MLASKPRGLSSNSRDPLGERSRQTPSRCSLTSMTNKQTILKESTGNSWVSPNLSNTPSSASSCVLLQTGQKKPISRYPTSPPCCYCQLLSVEFSVYFTLGYFSTRLASHPPSNIWAEGPGQGPGDEKSSVLPHISLTTNEAKHFK